MFGIFLICAQNLDCGYTLEPPRRGGSNECPQSMLRSKNKRNRYTPAYPSFCIYIKVGFKGVYITRTCFRDVTSMCTHFITHYWQIIAALDSVEEEEWS